MTTVILTRKLVEIGIKRNWWLDKHKILGVSTKHNYVRIGSNDITNIILKTKIEVFSNITILMYLKEIIYTEIPETINCGIKLYYSNNSNLLANVFYMKNEPHIVL